jgi:hypothetical protein
MDFSPVMPPGFGLVPGQVTEINMAVFTNTNPPQSADADFTMQPVEITGRQAWVFMTGGVAGRDYRLEWVVWDNQGHNWIRSALMLCADTA